MFNNITTDVPQMQPKWQMVRVKPDRDFEEEILTEKHCAKWTKSTTKRQTLCDSTYMSTQTIKTRNRKPRKRLRLFSGYRSELCKRKSPGDRARAHNCECSACDSATHKGSLQGESSQTAYQLTLLQEPHATACSQSFHFRMSRDTCSAKTCSAFGPSQHAAGDTKCFANAEWQQRAKLQASHSTMKVTDTLARCGDLCL